ncbi:MAG TPA: hypothetical protein VHO48_11290 [Anaerolineaceae bacterium]|nr:hypothetical protein [Anaerolineaceae bacterium]
MSEFDPSNEPQPQPPVIESREARESRNPTPWVAGVVLILLGGIFLLQNLGLVRLDNWWALFILIPAFGSFATAWGIYQHNGWRLNKAVRGPLIGGLILSMVSAAFLFDLNWGMIWPLFLILIGIGALITAFSPD